MPAAILVSLAAAAACGTAAAPTTSPSPGDVGGSVTVFAATSLAAAFKAEGAAFEAAHPRTTVSFNFAGSSDLATQIDQGAPADVFASADQPNLEKVAKAGNVAGSPRDFATNRLEIIVPPGDPRGVHALADLARPGLVVVLCAPVVPCGSYAAQALAKAGVHVTPASQEQNVGGVVSKVESGDADAGIVYTTDVRAADGKAMGITIPAADNVAAVYPIATLKGSANPAGGRAFIEFVLSAQGQSILARYGFGPA